MNARNFLMENYFWNSRLHDSGVSASLVSTGMIYGGIVHNAFFIILSLQNFNGILDSITWYKSEFHSYNLDGLIDNGQQTTQSCYLLGIFPHVWTWYFYSDPVPARNMVSRSTLILLATLASAYSQVREAV